MVTNISSQKHKKLNKKAENTIKREVEKVKGLLDELLNCRKEIKEKLTVFYDNSLSMEEKKYVMTDQFVQLQAKWDKIMMAIDPELVNKIRSDVDIDSQAISFKYLQQKKKKLLEEIKS